ncbi:DNA-methyltransferase [Turicimonas muris]|uniref:Methyltransferase n=1 Tax=Turicimonas muris TaxID=1796652 RepID=A0A227KNM2_9BURK|nr:DNA methyltransferase [Turicimonas muris]ARE60861.1 restriction endonuclease subunit M [Burkholderiales bacterium YL45]OXE49689.1 restriction endonuclease subunit M [Turicimonas muris]QQQ97191.1 site-specific DNA-methyltransferase [Turicimonas muris]
MEPIFEFENGKIFQEDCLDFLKSIPSGTADTVFADPPYNIKKAKWDYFSSDDFYIEWSVKWISECARILKASGTLYVCGFSEILADLKRPSMQYFKRCRWLVWYYDNKANLGKDWGRSHESVLCLRKSNDFIFNIDPIRIPYNSHTLKYPSRPLSGKTSQFSGKNENWIPNPLGAKPKDVITIPTTCNGMGEKTRHPTQKPEALIRKLLLASTNENDLVVDPFSGSGTTAVVATQLRRKFLVNDNHADYNDMAINRLLCSPSMSIQEWIEHDKKEIERRRKLK